MNSPLRLVVCDLDGVLTDGEARPLDLPFLGRLAALNQAARADPRRPAVTICSGRPAPYVEALQQAIDGHLPAVFENGAGLYFPAGYRFLPHPDMGDPDAMRVVRRRLEETLVRSGVAFLQPGKEYSLSVFATDPAATDRLHDQTTAALDALAGQVELAYSSSCLNVLPRGIDKSKGVAFLAAETDYALEEMLGVGDSDVDLPFLAQVGRSAAPANANEAVRGLVGYVSSVPTTAGVLEILQHFEVL